MIKLIVILEDSRKGGLGGGQKGSLEVVDALQYDFNLCIGDTSVDSLFAHEVQSRNLPSLSLRSTGRLSTANTASFSMHWFEYLIFPFHFMGNIIRIRRYLLKTGVSQSQTILYAAHKKRLAEAWLLNKFWGYKYVFHIRTYDSRKNILYPLLMRWMKAAVANIAVSQSVGDNVGLENVHVIPNPLRYPVRSQIRSQREPFIVAMFATLLGWKGIDIFMDSHLLLKNRDNIRFEIYGDGPLKGQLKTRESENVVLMGYSNDVMATMDDRVSLVCVPSTMPESFGRVSMEAFALGIPAIASNIGGQPEIIDDGVNGFLVEPGNSEAIASAIDRLFEDKSLYQKFSEEALIKAETFSYQVFSEKIVELFRKC